MYGFLGSPLDTAQGTGGRLRQVWVRFSWVGGGLGSTDRRASLLSPRGAPVMPSIDETFRIALQRHQAGDIQSAAQLYESILTQQPHHAGAWHLLGVVCQQRGELELAAECIGRAIALDPTKAVYHNNLGVVLRAQGKLAEAEQAYRRALAIRPDYPDALSNLALVLQEQKHYDEAQRLFCEALRLDPNHADAMYNLGNLYREWGRTHEAIAAYERAIEIQPNRAAAYNNLGIALLAERRAHDAIAQFHKAIALEPSCAEFHLNLGAAYAELDRNEEAAQCYEHACRLRPDKTIWRMRSCGLCPAVFQDAEELHRYRAELESRLEAWAHLPLELAWQDILTDGFIPSFHLAHHGCCNRRLKERFATIFDRHFPRPQPQTETGTPGLGEGKARIGFLVTRGREGGFLRGTAGIVRHLDPRRFQPVVLCPPSGLALCQRAIRRTDVTWVPLADRFSEAAEQIQKAHCDLLYHWQIGTDVFNYFLPFARLAPVQATGFGTHGTTGIAAVDYFLSSRLVEPEDAQHHYTERLYLLATMPTFQERVPEPGPASRSDFGLPDQGHLYFCPQRLSKFHPDFDPLIRGVLDRDPRAFLVLLEGRQPEVIDALRKRFCRTLGPVADRVIFLPSQPPPQYYRLLALADVLLDPPHYSSALTGYDAFALALPLVTLPGRLMVERYALGLYRKMQMDQLVARSAEHYITLAVQVASDRDYREHIRACIAERRDVLFEDMEAVRQHEEFFETALESARQKAG